MNNYYEQAMKKRIKAEEIAEEAADIHEWDPDEAISYEDEAEQVWEEHAELLRKIYPSPNPEHAIQVTIRDYYFSLHSLGEEIPIVCQTSFETLTQYIEAVLILANYEVDSEQVEQCEMCDKYYYVENGYTAYKRGFCSLSCLNEDELLRRIEGDYWEDQYAERAVDSDPYDTDTGIF